MAHPVDSTLAQRWLAAQAPADAYFHWGWFLPAFERCARHQCALAGVDGEVDPERLGEVFLAWARVVENSASFAALDRVDHAHFLCGRLLAGLFRVRPLRIQRAAAGGPVPGPEQSWPEGMALLTFVCTLLEAWLQQIQGQSLDWQAAQFQRHWQSFRENVTEDANHAGPFLDLFTGLEPAWEDALAIHKRPAMLRLLAQPHSPRPA